MPNSHQVVEKVGKALPPEEQKSVDQSKVAKLQPVPDNAEVEGQMLYEAVQICPYCGARGWGIESTDTKMYFTCHACGGTFTA